MYPVPINFAAVFVCGVVSMIIGFLWYGPLFGKQWAALMNFDMEKMMATKGKGMGKLYTITFVGSLVMAFVMAHSMIFASAYLHIDGIAAGLQGGFWNWLGFVAPVTLGTVLWDGKPWKLWILNNGYWLVLLLADGVILSLWK